MRDAPLISRNVAPLGSKSEWGRCSGVSGTDGDSLLVSVASAHESWSGLPMMVQRLPCDAVATDLQVHHPTLAIATSGRGKRRYTSGAHARDLYSSATMFELYAGGYSIDRACWEGVAGEVLGIQFPAIQVNRLLHAQGAGFRLSTEHEMFDARIADLMQLLWAEAREGGPRGRLYADGISLALLGLLIEEHDACARSDVKSRARLSPAQRGTLRDYIDANLARNLSVDELADLLDMSAAHFSRTFKASFGTAPHAYVMQQRVVKACRVLREDTLASLAHVAADLGFSSQSHFTEAFRKRVGETPGRWRSG